ncbi:DUF424 family protein [Ferroplasma sp.]|uniref:DUF424 domain-containing protein n=1 Tax=Ferroplasma sp. TaxID=2591003 RepID=UPI00307EC1EA
MKILNINGEVLLAAADSDIMNMDLREGRLHLNVKPEFYGDMKVSEETFISSLGICTIANLVGDHVVNAAIDANYIDKENIIKIDGVPYAQLAKII